MIERYTLPRMGALWTQRRKYDAWLQVELAVCEALEEAKKIPKGTAAHVRRKVTIDPDRIDEIEKVTKHDVIAFSFFFNHLHSSMKLIPAITSEGSKHI